MMLRAGILALAGSLAWGANCARTSVGFTPFTDPFPAAYKGYAPGLYPNGNQRPAAHEAIGLARAAQVVPRDSAGNPNPNGRIVLLSVGMSNTTQEFTAFISLAQQDSLRNPRLQPIDGAVGGKTAYSIATSPDGYWPTVLQRIQSANATPAQVQVIWLKEADASPKGPFPDHAQTLQSEIQTVIAQALARFPNLQIVYLSSRIYAGYATTGLNPEPYAYEGGFAVKWLIERQIQGAAELDAASGAFPWLAWGPYVWADGEKQRIDGLTWSCGDVRTDDGTHPSPSGQQKVARMLLDFFRTDPTARPWYLAAQQNAKPAIGAVVNSAGYGAPVASGSLATIFGSNLAASDTATDAYPLRHELGGTRVEVGGIPALLYFASPWQINFVVPPEGGQSVTVVRQQTASEAVDAAVSLWAPGIYTLDSAPDGPAAAVHADGRIVTPAEPALRDETLQLFGTGMGYSNVMILVYPDPTILVNGRKAEVTYAGLAPGLPGVTQVNFKVPPETEPGRAELVFRLLSLYSNKTWLQVQ
jgi:uncharacterized protein (TIGR03437 family)